MKTRFFYPNLSVLSSQRFTPALREAVQSLNGHTLDLSDAVKLIQTADPTAVVCAFAGFIAIRKNAEEASTALIRFEGAETDSELFQPAASSK